MIMETGIAVPNVKLIGGSEAAQSHLCRRCGCLRSSMFVDMACVPSNRGILRHAKSLAPSLEVKLNNPAEIRDRPGYGVDLRPVWRPPKIWHHRVMFTRRAIDDEDLELQQVHMEARDSLDSLQGTQILSTVNPSLIDVDRGASSCGGREYGQGEDPLGIIGSAGNSNIFSGVAMASKASVTSGNETGLTPRRPLEAGDVKLASQKFTSSVLRFSSTTVAAHSAVPKKSAMSRTDQAFLCLGFIAVALSGSISALLMMAIPTLRAMKKAAESVEKLADTAREELPGTMAALRLSGMEISDLTMELSDLSQDIGEGLRSSARAVQAAEDGLRRMGSFATNSTLTLLQTHATLPVEAVKPAAAAAAQTTRQAIENARKMLEDLAILNFVVGWVNWGGGANKEGGEVRKEHMQVTQGSDIPTGESTVVLLQRQRMNAEAMLKENAQAQSVVQEPDRD